LTAAAYNTGSTRIGKLLKERGYAKGSDDVFWQLQDALPQETRKYVPMLLAATIVGENAESFGLSVTPHAPWEFETVSVPGATELRAVARAAGSTLEAIKSLNPQYIKSMTPPERHSDVRVPVGATFGFAEAFARIPKDERTRALTKTHVVKSGETLLGIAKRYGTSVAVLQKVNRIKRPDAVAAGRKLVVPVT
jgi:membrane-bound lytic murein transglycosylase D